MIQIKSYSKLQRNLHNQIQKLITNNTFRKLNADDVIIVFGRIYSSYCMEALVDNRKIKILK